LRLLKKIGEIDDQFIAALVHYCITTFSKNITRCSGFSRLYEDPTIAHTRTALPEDVER
jgi:hypothetical protein